MNRQFDEKQALRMYMKGLRSQLTKAEVSVRSAEVCRHILEGSVYKRAKAILAYYPIGNEADVRPVLEQALADGKAVGLPRVLDARRMEFYRVISLNELEPGPMKLMEPEKNCPRIVLSEDRCLLKPALMLVPGLAFCLYSEGESENIADGSAAFIGRMGYGGGFYDTWLDNFYRQCGGSPVKRAAGLIMPDCKMHESDAAAMPLVTCGVAYDFQLVKAAALPAKRHDQRLHMLVTDKGMITNPARG